MIFARFIELNIYFAVSKCLRAPLLMDFSLCATWEALMYGVRRAAQRKAYRLSK